MVLFFHGGAVVNPQEAFQPRNVRYILAMTATTPTTFLMFDSPAPILRCEVRAVACGPQPRFCLALARRQQLSHAVFQFLVDEFSGRCFIHSGPRGGQAPATA
jgi:hypothetical protein